MLCCSVEVSAQGRNFYGFKNIVHGHAKIGLAKQLDYPPDDYYADINGGYIEIFLSKGQCSDKYRFEWKFHQDMSKLEPNVIYKAEVTAERIEGNCRQNEAWVQMSGSNESCRLCTDRNLTISTMAIAVKPKGDARAYAVPLDYNHSANFEINVARVAEEETMIFLSFSCTANPSPRQNFDYQVVYHYKKNYQPQTGSVGFDCQMLYGIGTNLAFLETAAANATAWDEVKDYLSEALKFVRASACLETDYLTDLKARMTGAEDTSPFYEEIKAYRERLPSLIPRDCIE
jgi:hypothetical protein